MSAAPPFQSRSARRQDWLERVDALLRNQGIDHAGEAALAALADGIEEPALLNLGAVRLQRQGRTGEALGLLQRARKLAPKDANVANSLGICLRALGRTEEAVKAYEAAIRADPRLAAAHHNRGKALRELNDLNRARAAHARAAELDPAYAEPLAALASIEAHAGDPVMARRHAEAALRLAPGNVAARIALASSAMQQGERDVAAPLLGALAREALTPTNRAIVLGLTGDLLDAEGRPDEAFAAYAAGNDQLRQLHAPRYAAPGTLDALGRAHALAGWFEAIDPAAWRDAPEARPRAADPAGHAFLVGFPRSGTTLLENVLAAHPKVVSLEEKDCLASVAAPYIASAEGLERLAAIGAGEAARARETYWACVRGHGVEPRGRMFIDKMPLSSALLPVIAKLFPEARILFATRDPRDVVLSCFRRRFGMNAGMYQLLTLDGAAGYYDAVMTLAEIYRERLPLARHEVRYEALVEDFDGTAKAACAFLGLEWSEDMRDFAARAKQRGIATPSAAQVARGLNRDGQGVWRRYAAQMAPAMPTLARWVERFGYPRD